MNAATDWPVHSALASPSRTRLGAVLVALHLGVLSGWGCAPSTGPIEPIQSLPRPLSGAEEQLVAAGNTFTFALFGRVSAAQPHANVFISPLSASFALGMTANGAAGETQRQMHAALNLSGLDERAINAGYRDLTALLLRLDRTTELRIANSIWYRDGIPFEQSFFDAARTYFDARVSGLDFGSPAAPAVVNDWVRDATAGRIEKVIDGIAGDDVMFLINALYFKGVWQHQFDPQATTPQPFRNADGTTAEVPLMRQEGEFRALFRPEVQGVELPYGNTAFNMVVLLPPPGQDINAFAASLTQDRLSGWLDAFRMGTLFVEIPRFKLGYERVLNPDLQALGMQQPFVPGGADFTRLSPMGRDLYISFVKQNTFVAVDEVGTEAAAVTTVGVRVVSAPPSFRADRPFVFLIRERFSGTILFIGKVVRLPE